MVELATLRITAVAAAEEARRSKYQVCRSQLPSRSKSAKAVVYRAPKVKKASSGVNHLLETLLPLGGEEVLDTQKALMPLGQVVVELRN